MYVEFKKENKGIKAEKKEKTKTKTNKRKAKLLTSENKPMTVRGQGMGEVAEGH